MRTCECGCGASLDGRRKSAHYVNRTHGQRAYRKRVEAAMRAKGLEPRVSLRVARTSNPMPKGNGDGPRHASARQASRKRASGMQLSWAKAVQAIAGELQRDGYDAEDAIAHATDLLRPALSDKQRTRLQARDGQ